MRRVAEEEKEFNKEFSGRLEIVIERKIKETIEKLDNAKSINEAKKFFIEYLFLKDLNFK